MNRPSFRRILLSGITLATAISGQAARAPAAAADLFATNVPGVSAVGGPPAGFDPVHATDAQLKAYAMPPRPNPATQPKEYGRWKRAMSLVKTREIGEITLTERSHGPAAILGRHTDASLRNTTYTTPNWSGFVNLNGLTGYNSTYSYYFVTSDYVIPVVKNRTCDGKWDLSSEWVGIDGFNGADVLQAGTESDAYCGSNGSSTSYYAWFEWYPYNESRISLPVSPGDDMYLVVWDTSATTGYAYLENQNTGVAQEFYLTAPSGTRLIGNTAEWIVEATASGGTIQTLADYNNDWFWGGSAWNFAGSEFVAGSSSSVQVNLVQGGTTVSVPFLANTQVTEYVYY